MQILGIVVRVAIVVTRLGHATSHAGEGPGREGRTRQPWKVHRAPLYPPLALLRLADDQVVHG